MVSTSAALVLVTLLGHAAATVPELRWAADAAASAQDVSQADADGLTPLMRAAARGRLAEVKALLSKGADPDARTPAQRVTALMCAAYFGHGEVVQALLDGGATLALKDAQGAAAVDWAALGDHHELEKTLTGPGAALNPFLNTGLMPMWLMDKAAGQ